MIGRFLEQAIARAGLDSILPARRRGDLDVARALLTPNKGGGAQSEIDLLVLGAIADAVRVEENGDVVRIHPTGSASAAPSDSDVVVWIREAATELDLLRAVAIARITGPIASRVGVDWARHGLELAQVALGFGATDLMGTITRKSGLVILEDDKKKVKGLGMVAASALKRREIAALVRNAGRICEFVDEDATTSSSVSPLTSPSSREGEAAHA